MGDLYVEYEYWITSAQLMMAMFAMGATLELDDFLAVLRLPKSFLTGLGAQLLLVPTVAFVALEVLDLDPGVAIGIAIFAAVPGGTTSNIYTYLGRGNVPLSIAITGVTTLACMVTVPIVLDALVGPFVPPDFTLPRGRIAAEIFATLLVPLGIGMLVLRKRPTLAPRLSRYAIRATIGLIALIVLGAAAAGRLDVEAMGVTNLLVVFGLAVVLFLVGVAAPLLARRSRPDVIAVAFEVTVRNTNLGLLIRASLFPTVAGVADPIADLALFTLLAFGGVSIIFVIPLVIAGRRRADAAAREGHPVVPHTPAG